jgi:hypothetical protein
MEKRKALTGLNKFPVSHYTITMIYQLPYFDKINAAALEGYYQSDIEFNGDDVSIDLTFESITADEHTIEKLISFLNNIVAFEAQNRILIKSDFNNEGDAAAYVQYFETKVPKELLGDAIGSTALQLLDKLELMVISLFPNSEDCFAQFDYYIKLTELHSQLLTVRLTETGELIHIAWES